MFILWLLKPKRTLVATELYTTVTGFDLLWQTYHSDSSNTTSLQFPWNDFWKTKAPMRILVNAWKIWHDAISTFSNLNRHHSDVMSFSLSVAHLMIRLSTLFSVETFPKPFGLVSQFQSELVRGRICFRDGSNFG